MRALGHAAYGGYCWLLFVVLSLAGVLMLVLLRGESSRMRFARALAKTLVRGCGLSVSVTGLEHLPPHGAAVIAAKHGS